ncbi:MAG TPA: zinc ribbon domain-containing protein [Steroidobacteraceae bacterium]|jgi:putative FmdB family regulatory protein|nr:zinc ribbon domain-containing protein [Steroidobacteraceae bacterium]
MPFYEYQCKSCGHELEAMQKVSDPPLRKCPKCGKAQLTRLMSAPVFRLKGGGWYETDFKGDKDNQRNLADRPDADAPKDTKGDSTGKDEKGKDSTEAKTAETKTSEAPAAKEPAAKEKSVDKSAEKSASSGAAQKPKAANRSSRGGRLKKKSIKVKRRR